MSALPLRSPPTRLVAPLVKATNRPSAERPGPLLPSFASTPAELTLTRVVLTRLAGPCTEDVGLAVDVKGHKRLVALLLKATCRPSAEILGLALLMLTRCAWVEADAACLRSV